MRRAGLGAVLAVAAVLLTGAATAALQQGGDSDLVDRLVALEQQLPALPPEMAVPEVADLDTSVLRGDFFGTSVGLEGLAEPARSLFIEADDAGGDTAQAVGQAARAIVDFRAAYEHLAEWEAYDVTVPIGQPGSDPPDASTFADELYGRAAIGVDLLERAHERRLSAYTVLRDAEASSDGAKAHFEVQYQAELMFFGEVLPQLRRAVSGDTTQEMLTVDRFESAVPTQRPRARSMTIACIDRDVYELAREAIATLVAQGAGLEGELPEAVAALPGIRATDCPDLPEATVDPVG